MKSISWLQVSASWKLGMAKFVWLGFFFFYMYCVPFLFIARIGIVLALFVGKNTFWILLQIKQFSNDSR